MLDEDLPQETPAAIEAMEPEDPALIVFTSGTTGEPRGVVHAYRYLFGQRTQAEHWFGSRKGELAWCTTATGWSKSARNVFLAPWLTGAAAVIHDGRFDPAERLELRRRRSGVNVLCQAPTEYRMLAKRTALRPLPALRRMVSAGEPLDPETIAAFRDRHRARAGRRLRPDRDRPGRPPTWPASRFARARWASRCRGSRPASTRPTPETGVGELQLRAASSPTFFSPLPRRRALRGRVVADRRPGPRRRRRLPLLRGPRRRHHPLLRLPDRPLRGRVGAAVPPRRRRGRRGRRSRPRARLRGPRDRRPPRSRAERGAGARAAGALQARRPRPTSSPASSSSSPSCRRRAAARSSARSCAVDSPKGKSCKKKAVKGKPVNRRPPPPRSLPPFPPHRLQPRSATAPTGTRRRAWGWPSPAAPRPRSSTTRLRAAAPPSATPASPSR